jgi:hypothetical protein
MVPSDGGDTGRCPRVAGKTRLGLGILGAALALGLLGDWLLRATPWGVNLFLWVAALVFAAAVAVFQSLLSDLFGFDLAEAFGHLSLTVALAWISAGALWASLLAQGRTNLGVRRPDILSLGIFEVGTVLGLLDLLFLAFVAVQVRYLFGGAERVLSTVRLTYAEYARRGFFELVTVTAIALPALLLAHWLLRAPDRRGEWAFRILADTLVALLFVVMASAMQRTPRITLRPIVDPISNVNIT